MQEISETYTFAPEDFREGRRKPDGQTFRDMVKELERDFHRRHSSEYAVNLYANSSTMRLLERACHAVPFLSYGMELTQGHVFDPVEDPFVNHSIEGYSQNIIVYGIDSAYMETAEGKSVIDEEKGIFPLTLLIDNSMRDGTIRLAVPTTDDGEEEEEYTPIGSPQFEYA